MSKLLGRPQIEAKCDISRSHIYALMAQGLFPKPIKIGSSARWIESEIDAWIQSRAQERDQEGGAA